MSLVKQIETDFILAFKEKNTVKKSALSLLKNKLALGAKDKKQEALSDTDAILVIKQQIKQREQSIAEFKRGGRQDLVDIEQAELDIFSAYLPTQMTEAELQTVIRKIVDEKSLVPGENKTIGLVMGILTKDHSGLFDNKLAMKVLKELV